MIVRLHSSQLTRSAGLIAAFYCAAMLMSQPADADVVTDWNTTAVTVLVPKGGPVSTHMAMVHLAIYDAVNGIDRRHRVYAVIRDEEKGGAILPMALMAGEVDPEWPKEPLNAEKQEETIAMMGAGLIVAYRYYRVASRL